MRQENYSIAKDNPMDSGWYIKFNEGDAEGPLSAATLKSRVQHGHVTPTTMVRRGTDGNWVMASHVKGLFGPGPTDANICDWIAAERHSQSGLPDRGGSHGATNETQESVANEVQFVPVTPPFQSPNTSSENSGRVSNPPLPPPKPVALESKNVSRLVPCVDCGQPISRLASTCPSCGCPVIEPSQSERYPALEFIAAINKFFAVVIPIACLIGKRPTTSCMASSRASAPRCRKPILARCSIAGNIFRKSACHLGSD